MRRDPTIGALSFRQLSRLPDIVSYAQRHGVELYDLLAYSANADGPDGRLRLVAVFPGHPSIEHPDVLCLDGPRESKHRNSPFEDGVFGKGVELCLYYRKDPQERRWTPENGLLGLFDLGRVHVLCEHEWRRTGTWPGEDAPHGDRAGGGRPNARHHPHLPGQRRAAVRQPHLPDAGADTDEGDGVKYKPFLSHKHEKAPAIRHPRAQAPALHPRWRGLARRRRAASRRQVHEGHRASHPV